VVAIFGRVLAACGGIVGAGSIVWGMVADVHRPDRFDIAGAPGCLAATTALDSVAEWACGHLLEHGD
jgi:small multidrug resistance family-3 protein